jgi:hypothetical protein
MLVINVLMQMQCWSAQHLVALEQQCSIVSVYVLTCAFESGVKRTTLEDTLGGGRKFCGPIKRSGSTFSHVCASTDGAPYSSSAGSAAACMCISVHQQQ